ncbi:uncharacterized protein LOC113359968 [Papaver somniferum]|uniref:uncharacterized protein LOC113359968 n=1 Tax=Papaver somniferum TaxID=3469 RepID=UPI000E6FD9C5|nr:uncharacterized protein LOC113359968 [Papaver somniferum]
MAQLVDINELPVVDGKKDRKIWIWSKTGEFTVASAMNCIGKKFPEKYWSKKIWKKTFHPSISSNLWKILRGVWSTDENMRRKGLNLASRCSFCKMAEENTEHILWYCNFSERIWQWLGGMFSFFNPISIDEILSLAYSKSPAIKEIWKTDAFITMKKICFLRNRAVFDDIQPNAKELKLRISQCTKEYEESEACQDTGNFGDQILLCCDGAARNNPGEAGYGFVGRDSYGTVLIAVAGGMGITTNFMAEVYAIINACEWAISKGFLKICIRSDSKAAITSFSFNKVPWYVLTRWNRITEMLISCQFIHSYREVNFSADDLAKRGALLPRGGKNIFLSRPPFMSNMENPNISYYRFS